MTKVDLFVMSPGIIGIILLSLFSCLGPGEGREVRPQMEPVVAEAATSLPQVDKPALPELEAAWEDIPLSEELQRVLRDECDRYGIDYALALGLIETESSFDPDADNGLCYGLMQLNRDYFPADLSSAENIRAGIEYLADQLGRYETVEAALCGYNAGHDTGARDYANAVLAAAERWEEQLNER